MTCPNLNTERSKIREILKRHQQSKDGEKEQYPDRFQIAQTLGELAKRYPQNDTQTSND